MRVGLYFGSFNPIHTGHLIIANHVINSTDLQEIWLVISPQNPLKSHKSLLNEYHRKLLVDLAVENNDHIRSSAIEFKLPRPSYTIDTLTYLHENYPQHQFYIIMGSDSFSNIKNWKNYKTLLTSYKIIIYERPLFPVDPTMLSDSILVLKAPLLDISSTFIRNLLAQKKSIRYLVTESVFEEIERQKFYQ